MSEAIKEYETANVEYFRQREEEPWFILKNCGDSERVHVSDCL